jgi:hypothetical protein
VPQVWAPSTKVSFEMTDCHHGLSKDVLRPYLILAMSNFLKEIILRRPVSSIGLVEIA